MKMIALTQDKVALVDDEDYDLLTKHKWCAVKQKHKHGFNWYAARQIARLTPAVNRQVTLFMHREIMNIDKRYDVDHRDNNGLNNQRSNLRQATRNQNLQNQPKTVGSNSQFKGVCWHKRDKRWRAQISINKHVIHLGNFKDEIEAAKTYDSAAKHYFGEFALTNFTV